MNHSIAPSSPLSIMLGDEASERQINGKGGRHSSGAHLLSTVISHFTG